MLFSDFFSCDIGQTLLVILEKSNDNAATLQKASNHLQARAAQSGGKISTRKLLMLDEKVHEVYQAILVTLIGKQEKVKEG